MNAFLSFFAIALGGWAAGVSAASCAQPVHPAVALADGDLPMIVPNAQVFVVQAMDCARPLFEGGVTLFTEAAPFELLAPGDIIVFRDPDTGQTIVERVLARRDEAHLTAGPERMAIGRDAYLGRVFGVFYTNASREEPPLGARDESRQEGSR